MRFCSPDKQRSIVIAPTPEGGVPMGENPFDCSADQSYLIPTQPQSAATVRAVDPCRLIAAAEAESALGAAVRKVPPHYQEPHTWNCIYQVGEDQQRRLSLKADEAYLFDSPAGFATLDARLGDTLLEFSLGGPPSGREQTITRLAHQAVQRMVAGEGIAAEASPDAKLTGEWTASAGGRTLLMIVRQDKALTISVSASQNGVLTTNGNRTVHDPPEGNSNRKTGEGAVNCGLARGVRPGVSDIEVGGHEFTGFRIPRRVLRRLPGRGDATATVSRWQTERCPRSHRPLVVA
ncbi:MAG: hypothetical protein LJE91_13675 [Gammaproteobacteria bacterium]|nr:hypothetical protein [Gammaproteobacteria bacterium]